MNMPHNAFKAALRKDAAQYGIWAGFATAYAAEIVASTGYDWMLIDGEHAPTPCPACSTSSRPWLPTPPPRWYAR